jgi:hypothetical protein
MKTLDEINTIKFTDLDADRFKNWLKDELFTLADDFGQKIDNEQMTHIAFRMKEILCDKFRTWDAGTVHNIFQLGIAGQYGKAMKITVHSLVGWLYSAKSQMIQDNITHPGDFEFGDTSKSREYYNKIADKCIPFIHWCQKNNINVSELSTEYYERLRDEFNENGEWVLMDILDELPKYAEFGNIETFIKLRK